ncbi:MAG: tryptophan synthase subunit beta [Planctomycetota bacterium]
MSTLLPSPTAAKPGRFGRFGGAYVPEILVGALARLNHAVEEHLTTSAFQDELAREARDWIGRATPLTFAPRLSERLGARLHLKREDLCHTGAHKINNALGQALLARRMGAKRVIAETGAGQHGVATAAACARLGLPCTVYMGAHDVARQALNVRRMELFGAEVRAVTALDATLRAAIDEALRDWSHDPEGTYYLLGSAVGPHPYPTLVRELQSVIGREARTQFLEAHGRLPDAAIACVGGGSNSIGLFHAFRDDAAVALIGVEAGGTGDEPGRHGATLAHGRPGVLHGTYSYLLQDEHGQVTGTHSISAGLDYPGVGPEHAELKERGRARYLSVRDTEALAALEECARLEGILPALESAHALAGAGRIAAERPGSELLVCCSGRGDKDLGILAEARGGVA